MIASNATRLLLLSVQTFCTILLLLFYSKVANADENLMKLLIDKKPWSYYIGEDEFEADFQKLYGTGTDALKLSLRRVFYKRAGITFDSYSQVKQVIGSSPKQRIPFPCRLRPECTCSKDGSEYFLHCEKELHASKGTKLIRFVCNYTLATERLSHDYHSFFELKEENPFDAIFYECPQPERSYASLFLPRPENKSGEINSTASLRYLHITCGNRKTFDLARKHFEGLKSLKSLFVVCPLLSELPSDLLISLTEVEGVSITNTRVEYLPDGLFLKSRKLHYLLLFNNRLKKIQNDAFLGPNSLEILHIQGNELSYLEENVFAPLRNLIYLNISQNNLANLPKSLRYLTKLTSIDLKDNSISEMKAEYCSRLGSLRDVTLSNNNMKLIDQSCFTASKDIRDIDISGNSLSKITDQPGVSDSVKFFKFNGNSIEIPRFEKFLNSTSLLSLEASNSSIQSLDPDVLQSMPNLRKVDVSGNDVSDIHKDIFSNNSRLRLVELQQNNLSVLPETLFRNNPDLRYLDLSYNNLRYLSPNLLGSMKELKHLDLSGNLIEEVPETFLSNATELVNVLLSANKLRTLRKRFLNGMNNILSLNLSSNFLDDLPRGIFLPIKDHSSLEILDLKDNLLSHLPFLELPSLKYLILNGNMMEELQEGVFHSLPELRDLFLSKNQISRLPDSPLVKSDQKLDVLDMSHNELQYIPKNMLREAAHLRYLDLSGNRLNHFFLETISFERKLLTIKLSSNNMSFFGFENSSVDYFKKQFSTKVLDLSNNKLSFDYCSTLFDEKTATWGKVSPFLYFPAIEELRLSNNSITTMFLDWRNMLPHLRILDLRSNKIMFVTHQDMLFTSVTDKKYGAVVPYYSSRSLSVDLRKNRIRGVELPSSMLMKTPPNCGGKSVYSHAKFILDENPFVCGCRVMNLLRALDDDVVLTSELFRTTGKDLILAAKLVPGNLSCWNPSAIRGKKLTELEEWMHHLLPMAGLCALRELSVPSNT